MYYIALNSTLDPDAIQLAKKLDGLDEHQIVLEGKDKMNEGGPLTESTSNQIPTENLIVNNHSVLPNFWSYIDVRKPFGPGRVRLEWTCVSTFLSKI